MITNTLFHGDSSVTLQRVARESVDCTEKSAMSNAQINNINKNNMNKIFRNDWHEGCYDEWIYVYNTKLKLLLITYANSDYTNIYNRIILDENEDGFTSKAEKIARNVELDEVIDAVAQIVFKDDSYMSVNIDWSNKQDVLDFNYS